MIGSLCKHVENPAYGRVLRGTEHGTILDVGAHVGGMTKIFLEHKPRKIIAIEPHPVLSKRIRDLELPNVIVRQEAVSSVPGHLSKVLFHNAYTLAVPGLTRLSPSVSTDDDPVGPGFENLPFDVEVTTIDRIVDVERVTDLTFMKIDVDGYDLLALRGAEETIRRFRPPIMFELSWMLEEFGTTPQQMFDWTFEHRYRVVRMDGTYCARRGQFLAGFPWESSCDVILCPEEQVNKFDFTPMTEQ